jgi:hypothetical protein
MYTLAKRSWLPGQRAEIDRAGHDLQAGEVNAVGGEVGLGVRVRVRVRVGVRG